MYSCNTEPGFSQCAPRSLGDVPVGLRLKKIQQRTARQGPRQSIPPRYRHSNRQRFAAKSCAVPSPFYLMGEVSHCFSSTPVPLIAQCPFPQRTAHDALWAAAMGPTAPLLPLPAPGTAAPLSGSRQHSHTPAPFLHCLTVSSYQVCHCLSQIKYRT